MARNKSVGRNNTDAADQVTLDIQGQQVTCTNLTKTLYPQARFTTMAAIAEAQDAVWQSNRATDVREPHLNAKATNIGIPKWELDELPRVEPAFIEPMQAKLVDNLPEGEAWDYGAKFDGYRVLIVKKKTVSILSRRNNVLSDQFPTITAACAELQDGSGTVPNRDSHSTEALCCGTACIPRLANSRRAPSICDWARYAG